MFGGQWIMRQCAWRVVRVQNNALLKGASAVRQGCCEQAAVVRQWHVSRNSGGVSTWRNCYTVLRFHFVRPHKFRKAGQIFLHKPVPFANDVSTDREGSVSINVLFSSENGKNKVVAKRECKHSRTTTSLQKVTIVALAFHVMPRQRLYPDDFGQIPIFARPMPGITWNA